MSADGHRIALLRQGDRVWAIEDRCPHMAFPLSQGRVREGKLLCTLHHWEFPLDGDDAEVAPEHRLVRYPARVRDDGTIEVDTSAL